MATIDLLDHQICKKICKNEDIIVSSDSNIIQKISANEKVKFLKDLKIFLVIMPMFILQLLMR
jgi:hypothetical protein